MGLNLNNLFIIIPIILAIFLINSPAAKSQEVEDEKEFSYERGGEIGPEKWGHIHKEWAVCENGEMQSPIDLSHERVKVCPDMGRLRRSYRPARAVLKNRGHDIMLEWEDEAGKIWIEGNKYALKQIHWHSPSEHTIDGQRYSLEMHMVHQSDDGKLAVVGILYKTGRPDPFLAQLEEHIKKIGDVKEGKEEVGMMDPRHIRRGSRKYYRYMGSLTVPPCTEGVVWTIVWKVRTVSKEQIHLLREAVHDGYEVNARPIQLINDRAVEFYRPRKVQY